MARSKHDTKIGNRQEHVDRPTHLQDPQIFSGYHPSRIVARICLEERREQVGPNRRGLVPRMHVSGTGPPVITIWVWDPSLWSEAGQEGIRTKKRSCHTYHRERAGSGNGNGKRRLERGALVANGARSDTLKYRFAGMWSAGGGARYTPSGSSP